MASNTNTALPEERQIERQDGEVTFSFPCVDGIAVPPFEGLMRGGPAERFLAIRDLKTDKRDIILATFLKSGTLKTFFFLF